jgi:branched-subunit amino acid aminotransferase/4-amino-4-deoxychorismate lyase
VLGPIARAAGVSVRETTVRPEELASFSECFITGTTREVHPVSAIDQVRFALGPDTVTAKLQQAFANYTADYVKRHKMLRVLPRAPRAVTT